MNLDAKGILIGALAAILFYVVAVWLLDYINFAVPNVILALVAILIFLGFVTGKINV